MQSQEGSLNQGAGIKTYLVFLDLPIHYEFKTSDMPMLSEGTIIEFNLHLVDPKSQKKRHVEGPHFIMRRKLIYSASAGLTQYLELSKIDGRI